MTKVTYPIKVDLYCIELLMSDWNVFGYRIPNFGKGTELECVWAKMLT